MNSLQNINSTKQQISVFYYSEIEEVFACMHLMIEKKSNREINIFTDSDQNQSFVLLQDSLARLWPCLVYTQNYIILDDPVQIHKIDQADKKKLEEELRLTEKTIILDSITMCHTPMRYNEKKHRWEDM